MLKARVTTVLVLLMLLLAAPAAARRQDTARAHYRLGLPDKDWALDLTFPPRGAWPWGEGPACAGSPGDVFCLAASPIETLSDDGREYTLTILPDFGTRKRDFFFLKVALSPAKAAGEAVEVRTQGLKLLSKRERVRGLKTWERGQAAAASYRLEFELPTMGALPGNAVIPSFAPTIGNDLRTAQAVLVKDGVWISVGLITRSLGEREVDFFNSLLDSLKFTDTSAPSTSFDFYHKGRILYLSRNYRRASEALAAALELEKRERRLDRASWRGLVINLVDAHAAARDYERAKEILDFGIAEDPTNPAFYLALAHYHALRDDLDGVIASLEKVYLNREKGPRAAAPPDPEINPAFERYRKNERFRKAVKAMKKLKSGV